MKTQFYKMICSRHFPVKAKLKLNEQDSLKIETIHKENVSKNYSLYSSLFVLFKYKVKQI